MADKRGTVNEAAPDPPARPGNAPTRILDLEAAPIGLAPSPSRTRRLQKRFKLSAMLPPGVCTGVGTEMPYPLSR